MEVQGKEWKYKRVVRIKKMNENNYIFLKMKNYFIVQKKD